MADTEQKVEDPPKEEVKEVPPAAPAEQAQEQDPEKKEEKEAVKQATEEAKTMASPEKPADNRTTPLDMNSTAGPAVFQSHDGQSDQRRSNANFFGVSPKMQAQMLWTGMSSLGKEGVNTQMM